MSTTYAPVAYAYDADHHCPDCAIKRFGVDVDGYMPEDAEDHEGNPIGAIAPWDEWWNVGEDGCDVLSCSDCGAEIDIAHADDCPGHTSSIACLRGIDVERILASYIECAVWSSVADEDCTPLDRDFTADDLSDEAREAIREDVLAFAAYEREDVLQLDPGQVGHDFWLTRNRHGAGFWDRGLGEVGERLTRAAHAYGSSDLYVGDDGLLYVS